MLLNNQNGESAKRPVQRNGDFDLELALNRLGMTGSDLAREVAAHVNTVSRWRNGSDVPGGVVAYLKLRLRLLDVIGG